MSECIPHLIALRKSLIRVMLVFLLCFSILFYFDTALYHLIAKPLLEVLSEPMLVAIDITATFTVPMKLAFMMALFLTIPYGFIELWFFVAPGLYAREKRTFLPLLLSSLILFYMGVFFSFFVICPICLRFFIAQTTPVIRIMADIRNYLEFILSILLAGGIAFQVPVLTLALLQANVISSRVLSHLRPYIVVLAFVLGMLLTPPDVLSQVLVAVPMWGLFEIGLLIGKYLEKKQTTVETRLKSG